PAEHEQALAADPVGERTGDEIGQRLRHAEADDEGEHRRIGREVEVVLADQRQNAPLEPHHRPDERVDPDQQAELRGVRAQPEPDPVHACAGAVPAMFALTIAAWSAGGGGTSASSSRTNASSSTAASARLWSRSKPIVESGLPESERPQTEPP